MLVAQLGEIGYNGGHHGMESSSMHHRTLYDTVAACLVIAKLRFALYQLMIRKHYRPVLLPGTLGRLFLTNEIVDSSNMFHAYTKHVRMKLAFRAYIQWPHQVTDKAWAAVNHREFQHQKIEWTLRERVTLLMSKLPLFKIHSVHRLTLVVERKPGGSCNLSGVRWINNPQIRNRLSKSCVR
jgi:hypothetical protein